MTETTTERPPFGIRRAIATLKDALSIEDYLRAYDVEVKRNRARCIVHGGDNPNSFSIEPQKQLWHCFSCGHGGDLIDLHELHDRHPDVWTAVVSLSIKFDIELPTKPARWHEWQDEKSKVRDAAKKHIAGIYQRRLTRVYAPLVLLGGETPEEELETLEELSRALWLICLDMAGKRVSGEE